MKVDCIINPSHAYILVNCQLESLGNIHHNIILCKKKQIYLPYYSRSPVVCIESACIKIYIVFLLHLLRVLLYLASSKLTLVYKCIVE